MANLKISEMTPAAKLTGAELIECVQGGVNVKQEFANISGRIISFDDNGSGETNLQLDFVEASGLVFRSSSGNYFPTVSMSSVFPITIGTEYSCLIKIRDNLLEFIVNGITRISHTLVTPYYNSNKKLDFGGFGVTDAIYGYMDNIKLSLLYK